MDSHSAIEEYPLTTLQEGMLFQRIYTGRPGVDLLQVCVEMRHSLDLSVLEDAWHRVIRHNPALRTRILYEGRNEPVQEVTDDVEFHLTAHDLSGLTPEGQQDAIEKYEREDRDRGLDISSAPPMRVAVYRRSEKDHRMVWAVHHIVVDGRACTLVLKDVFGCYEAQMQGRTVELPVRRAFSDYVNWTRHLDSSQASQFWSEKLKGFANPTPILKDQTTSRLITGQFAGRTEQSIYLSPELSAKLKELMKREGLSLNTLVQGMWAILLSRYSGEDDIVFGATKTTRRAFAGAESMVGPLIVTVPVRVRVCSEAPLIAWLRELRAEWLSYRDYDHAPLTLIQQSSEISRGASLFETFVVFENGAFDDGLRANGGGWRDRTATLVSADTNYALTLMGYGGEELELRICYDAQQFSSATIQRMLEHLRTMAVAVAEKPDLTVGDVPLLTGAERRQLVEEWNETPWEYPGDKCLHELFEEQVTRRGNAVALIFGDNSLTYAELNARANQLGHYLKRQGIGPGQRVGLCVERSLAMMVGLLGIQKSGAAYVPLDPAYPAERLRLTLEDAQLTMMVTEGKLSAHIPEYRGALVCLDRDCASIAAESTTNTVSGATPEDLIYVIFTSGSTGRPKGVMVPHRAVVNLMTWMANELQMGKQDVFPALASFAFDMSIPELYLALVSGGTVAIGEDHLAANGEELAEFLMKNKATIVHATPTTWNLLLESGFTGKGLKMAIGAEALLATLFTKLMGCTDSLYNFYGPTETTVWSAYHCFKSKDEPIVIGRPLGNTRVYIRDKHGNPTPIGVPGEIQIGGDGVTRGYLNRPELTAEKFIADPFSDKPNAKLYRTGDVGRFLADGRIEFQGRADHQVKVRGYRVELGEIETALNQHTAVQECVVVAREDVPGDKRLVAYVVPAPGHDVDSAELRSWVKSRVPEYMVPVAWIELAQLPLSPNGKVDRKNLPAPEFTRRELEREYVAPRTAAEEGIAGIWAELLNMDRVGMADNFFELGGHSLLATRVVLRIRQAFQVELPIRTLFEHPVLADLAKEVETLQRKSSNLVTPPLKAITRLGSLELSFAQHRLWFMSKMDPANSFYNLPFATRLRGPLNVNALTQSLNTVVRRHETLRTAFVEQEGEVIQVIEPHVTLALPVVDLRHIEKQERVAEGQQHAQRESLVPFDLERAPLIRAKLLQFEAEEYVLIINMHHIISDAWSRSVFVSELAVLYEALIEGKSSPLSELPIQYADYVVWQRSWLRDKTLANHVDYWRKQLRDAPPVLQLPSDRPRPPVQSFQGAMCQSRIPRTLVSEIKRVSQAEGVTLFMYLLAAFQALLFRYSEQEQIIVGTDLANRTSLELEKLIGFFVNLLPICTNFSGNPTFREVLGRVREVTLGAYSHQDMPFEKLVEELSPDRTLSHNPLVQVLFVMLNTPSTNLQLKGLQARPFEFDLTRSKFDVVVYARELDEGLAIEWLYSTDLFDRETARRMAENYATLLADATLRPAARIGALQFQTDAERVEKEALRRQHQLSTSFKPAKRKPITLA